MKQLIETHKEKISELNMTLKNMQKNHDTEISNLSQRHREILKKANKESEIKISKILHEQDSKIRSLKSQHKGDIEESKCAWVTDPFWFVCENNEVKYNQYYSKNAA